MIATISILVIAAAIVVVLTYNGVFTDTDKDGIPDKVEQVAQEIKEDIKETAKKVKKKATRKTKKS